MPPFSLSTHCDTPLVLVTGKGGVGKSTLCALLAMRARAAGRRALVCTMEEGLVPEVQTLHIDIEQAVVEAAARLLPTPRLARKLMGSRPVRRFLSTAPGARGFAVLEAVAERLSSGGWDQVIVDLPATGHALSLLDAPQALASAIGRGALAARAHQLIDLIHDPQRTALALVTLPEEMPVNETLELIQRAEGRLHIRPSMVVLNQLHPSPALPARHDLLMRLLSHKDDPALTDTGRAQLSLFERGLARARAEQGQRARLEANIGDVPSSALPWWPAADEPSRLQGLHRLLQGEEIELSPALEALA